MSKFLAACAAITALSVAVMAVPVAAEHLHVGARSAAEDKLLRDLFTLEASIEQGLNEPDLSVQTRGVEADTLYGIFTAELRPTRAEAVRKLVEKLGTAQAAWKAVLPQGACYSQYDVTKIAGYCESVLAPIVSKLNLKIEDVSDMDRKNNDRYTNRNRVVSPVLAVLSSEIQSTVAQFK